MLEAKKKRRKKAKKKTVQMSRKVMQVVEGLKETGAENDALEDRIRAFIESEKASGSTLLSSVMLAKTRAPLPLRDRQLSIEYALDRRPLSYWAKRYGVSPRCIRDILSKPEVQALIAEVDSNIVQRSLAKRVILHEMAMDVYMGLIRKITDPELLLRATMDIMKLNIEWARLRMLAPRNYDDGAVLPGEQTHELIPGPASSPRPVQDVTPEEAESVMYKLNEMLEICNSGNNPDAPKQR